MNLSTTLNSTIAPSSEEMKLSPNPKASKEKWRRAHMDQWLSPALEQPLLRTLHQPATGCHLTRVSQMMPPSMRELSQEDRSGLSIDRLTAHQEDHIRVNSLMLLESTVTNQEISYHTIQTTKATRRTNSLSEPPKWPLTSQATTALSQPPIQIFLLITKPRENL